MKKLEETTRSTLKRLNTLTFLTVLALFHAFLLAAAIFSAHGEVPDVAQPQLSTLNPPSTRASSHR